MKQSKTRPLHQCTCETCQQHPYGEIAEEHRAINRVLAILDEKSRRRFVGLLASQLDHGVEPEHHLSRARGSPTCRTTSRAQPPARPWWWSPES
jgi:hypothetical protein